MCFVNKMGDVYVLQSINKGDVVFVRYMKLFVGLIILATIMGCSSSKKDLAVLDVYTAELPPGKSVAAIYLKIQNPSQNQYVLNYIHSPIFDHIELHRNIYEKGMMKMRPVSHLTVKAKSEVIFEPGGYHLMAMGADKQLKNGDSFDITLEFEGGKTIQVKVAVRRLG